MRGEQCQGNDKREAETMHVDRLAPGTLPEPCAGDGDPDEGDLVFSKCAEAERCTRASPPGERSPLEGTQHARRASDHSKEQNNIVVVVVQPTVVERDAQRCDESD